MLPNKNQTNNRNINKEKGIALLVTLFIMGISLSIVLGVTVILVSEMKMIREIGYSVKAFFAADRGMEEVLFLDNKRIPTEPEGISRGFCDICNTCVDFGCNPSSCVAQLTPEDSSPCDENCTTCYISYSTPINGTTYYDIRSTITPEGDIFKSYGIYSETTRAIELSFRAGEEDRGSPQGPLISNTSVIPWSVEEGIQLQITADIYDPDGVASGSAKAHVQYPNEHDCDGTTGYNPAKPCDNGVVDLSPCTDPDCSSTTYRDYWIGPEGFYYVDITACDTKGNCSEKENIY